MEEIQEHVAGRGDLAQEQLDRVGGTLPRLSKRRLSEPLGERFPAAFRRCLDLLQLLGRKPGGDGFRARDGTGFGSGRRGGSDCGAWEAIAQVVNFLQNTLKPCGEARQAEENAIIESIPLESVCLRVVVESGSGRKQLFTFVNRYLLSS